MSENSNRGGSKSRRAFLRDAGLTLAGTTVLAGQKTIDGQPLKEAAPELKAQSAKAESVGGAEGKRPAKLIVLENKHVRFEFDAEHMGLCSIISGESGTNHVPATEGEYLLWELALARGTQIESVNNTYKPCDQAKIETLPDGTQRLTAHWKQMRWWLEDRILNVDVSVDLPADSGIAQWHIEVENLSNYWGLWTITFPVVTGFPKTGTYDLAKPIFGGGGELVKGFSEPVAATLPSGSWSVQFAALNAGMDGVYLGTCDPDGRGKEFVLTPGSGSKVVHYAENMAVPGSGYPGYYATELGVYKGTWIQAAKHYRAWAINQKWLQRGPLSQRDDVPKMIKDVGLWVTEGFLWNPKPGTKPKGMGYTTHHGAIEMPTENNALYLEAQKQTGVPMGVHWYNWFQSEFNHNFPDFIPPRIANFKERVKELVDAGWLVMPYINGVSADLDLPEFQQRFASAALTDQAGSYFLRFYGDSAGRLLEMCPSQTVWQQAIYEQSRGLHDTYGVNAVYVDQVSAIVFRPCFNPTHGHPMGGGRSWSDGYRDLLAGLKTLSDGDKPLVITSESMNEIFLDVLDANLTWGPPSMREIPLIQAIYSGYTLFFASPCDYAKSIRYFRWVQGTALMDGRQNGWVDVFLFQPEYKDRAEYFTKCGVYRGLAPKFLTYGELLDIVEFEHPVPPLHDEDVQAMPSVQGRLWRSEDRHLGVILANYADEATTVSFRLDPIAMRLGSARYAVDEVTPSGTKRLASGQGELRHEQHLGPGEIAFLEVSPQK